MFFDILLHSSQKCVNVPLFVTKYTAPKVAEKRLMTIIVKALFDAKTAVYPVFLLLRDQLDQRPFIAFIDSDLYQSFQFPG